MNEKSRAGQSPAESKEPPALAHIEKTLADSYRKEIDQEENIWRSLPFFAATLALQLAALFQVIERVPTGKTSVVIVSYVLVAASVGFSLGALIVLAWSIFPAKFQYVAKDSELLDYALGLIEDENHPANATKAAPLIALHTLKESLARQYAKATDNNRRINKAREMRRSIAGLLTILSVVSTLLLVGETFATYVPKHDEKGVVSALSSTSGRGSGSVGYVQPTVAPGPANAGSH